MARESTSSARKTAKAQLKPQVIALKRQNYSFREIGDMLNCSHEAARNWYFEAISEYRDDADAEAAVIQDLKQDSVSRVLAIIRAWHPVAVAPLINEEGEPCGMDSQAAGVVLKYEERLAKLLGFDAPRRADITSNGQTIEASTGAFVLPMVQEAASWTEASKASAAADEEAAERLAEGLSREAETIPVPGQ